LPPAPPHRSVFLPLPHCNQHLKSTFSPPPPPPHTPSVQIVDEASMYEGVFFYGACEERS
jgi:hypothetical protein